MAPAPRRPRKTKRASAQPQRHVVLFSGPAPAAKKSATALARGLGKDLLRIDLSAVVSKYIGETEKNLSRVFARAEAANAVLFFDEADSLFGKRTNVSDAHDRFANIDTSYLLQRFEDFNGPVILALRESAAIDTAVLRRFTMVMDFSSPPRPRRR